MSEPKIGIVIRRGEAIYERQVADRKDDRLPRISSPPCYYYEFCAHPHHPLSITRGQITILGELSMPASHNLTDLSQGLLVIQPEVTDFESPVPHLDAWLSVYATSKPASVIPKARYETLQSAINGWSTANGESMVDKASEAGMTKEGFESWVGYGLGEVAERTVQEIDVRVLTEYQVTQLEGTHTKY
jgi:hypothetical protein